MNSSPLKGGRKGGLEEATIKKLWPLVARSDAGRSSHASKTCPCLPPHDGTGPSSFVSFLLWQSLPLLASNGARSRGQEKA
jgi:hypothetical protein